MSVTKSSVSSTNFILYSNISLEDFRPFRGRPFHDIPNQTEDDEGKKNNLTVISGKHATIP